MGLSYDACSDGWAHVSVDSLKEGVAIGGGSSAGPVHVVDVRNCARRDATEFEAAGLTEEFSANVSNEFEGPG